ncbi:MAG TPA: YggS family pyridoxal phosphate-dependent enzyme [Armatimonadota bacterium]|nr:YggS family pyridoxal phosphate-dependent enzyme [Armatimonadota bacterium]
MSVAENLLEVRRRIADAAARAGTDPERIALVAVTKTVDVQAIQEAIQAGVTDIGENYVQDAVLKYGVMGRAVRWHMIGHLQTNKVRHAVPIFDLIQSVDSIHLAEEIGRRSLALGKHTGILVEVNISGEASRFGVQPADVLAFCEAAAGIESVALKGLMGMAPFVDEPSVIRRSFVTLRGLWDRLPREHRTWLSIGMTADFEVAIEEGSNMVRIGTAIFGPREQRPS